MGLRGDYMLDYEDNVVEIDDEKYGLYQADLKDFNNFVLSGLIGVGLGYKGLVYIKIEFNPAIT